jgi:hypothetical protein
MTSRQRALHPPTATCTSLARKMRKHLIYKEKCAIEVFELKNLLKDRPLRSRTDDLSVGKQQLDLASCEHAIEN